MSNNNQIGRRPFFGIFAISLASVGDAVAQKRIEGHDDVSLQRVSRTCANAIFSVKKHLETVGIDHSGYDYSVRIEPDFVLVSANYRTDGEGRRWNMGLRGCSARGRPICTAFRVRTRDWRIVSELDEPQ
jgi:hypothetical protein